MNDYERAAERVDKKLRFYKNLMSYICVNGFLAIINAVFSPDFWWVMFPAFFWGIGVLKDFLKAFVFEDICGEEYRERKIKQEMEKLSK
ncbi:2TM domain-containing protein [uncultured Methanobrevibacter sp.]|uniref:2TM domain-containing protein n=1 Tax=uncultured Methanobrevibacter sp. TaxID=253161 RepID=UPI0025D95434|nr:2TM domain-containing protein [uncultured Methanobrevibacter sp.]